LKRRAFLGAAAAGAAVAASWPAWLRSAFAQDQDDLADPLGTLSRGFRGAQRSGKPLLVLVVPATDEHKWQRGQAFGEVLNHGGQQVMVELAMCEVICAPMSAVRQLAPQTPAAPAEPLMILIETDAVPARVTPLDAELVFETAYRGPTTPDVLDRAIDRRIAAISRLIHRSVIGDGDGATLARRAAQVRARLGADTVARIDASLRAGRIDPRLADRGAAHILASELVLTQPVAAWHRWIAAGATARLRRTRIAGSHWATSTGCGITIEDADPMADQIIVGCGMGHSPPRSQRFLHFFAQRRGA
jgi:hypothetical protein